MFFWDFPNGANCIMPAFANRISIWPSLSFTTSNDLSRSTKLDTSLWIPLLTFLPIYDIAVSSSFLLRSIMKTYTPSDTNLSAIAYPMQIDPSIIVYISIVYLTSWIETILTIYFILNFSYYHILFLPIYSIYPHLPVNLFFMKMIGVWVKICPTLFASQ